MDASRFVRAVQRHALLVVVTATLAGAIMVVGLFVLPERYRATADVVVLLPDTQTGSLLATTAQAVSDFEGAIRSSAVTGLAAKEAGVSGSSVADGLTTEPLVGGSIIEVTYTGSDADVAETIVTTASQEAILLLLHARLGPVSQRLDAAQAAMNDANEALEAFRIENELIDPEEYFFEQQRQLADWQEDQDQAEIAGEDDAVTTIQSRIDALVQRVAPLRTDFDALRTAREQAAIGLQQARDAFATADASVQAAEEASSITVLPATRVPRTERLLSQLLVVMVIATALTIGMIVLLELLAPQRLTRGRRPSDAEPEAPAAVGARRGPRATRPAASAPMRAASDRAPRPVEAADARPVPTGAEPAPPPKPPRREATTPIAPVKSTPDRPRSARDLLDGSSGGGVSDPREPAPDQAVTPTSTSDRRAGPGPAPDRALTAPDRAAIVQEAPRPGSGLYGGARTASVPLSGRTPAGGATAAGSDAATLESGGSEASSDAEPLPAAKPSTSSEAAKRSRSRSKKRRSKSVSDAATTTSEASQDARGVPDAVEPPKPPTPTERSKPRDVAPSEGTADTAAGERDSAGEASSVENVEASSQETAGEPSGAEPRRDLAPPQLAPPQEDPPAPREDAPEEN